MILYLPLRGGSFAFLYLKRSIITHLTTFLSPVVCHSDAGTGDFDGHMDTSGTEQPNAIAGGTIQCKLP